MGNALEQTQRWWAATNRADFLTGNALHLSDSPDPRDWGLMYRWHMLKQASTPLALGSVMGAFVVVMALLPGSHILAGHVLKPLLAVVGAAALALGGYVYYRSRRQPFSVITARVSNPQELSDRLEELWPALSQDERQDLRRRFIRAYETQKTWTPEELQQALESQLGGHRPAARVVRHGN